MTIAATVSKLIRDLMRYLFLIYSNETATDRLAPDEVTRVKGQHAAVMGDAAKRGVLLGLDKLKPTATATTVRMDNSGAAMIIDGPFAETKEQLAGYYMIECADLDEAIEWA